MAQVEPRVTTPTADEICREAFRLIAGRQPTAEQANTAVKKWLEEALGDIWHFATHQDITRFKALENSAVLVLTKGRRRYSFPDDFHRPICATLVQGDITGEICPEADMAEIVGELDTVEPADGTYYLPATNEGSLEDYFADAGAAPFYTLSGRYLIVTSGDAKAVMREVVSVTDYDNTNLIHVFELDEPWIADEIPVAADTFMICSERGLWIDEEMREELDNLLTRTGTGLPIAFNDFEHQIEFDVAFDDTNYALLLRYFANPLKINKQSFAMQRILTNWRVVLGAYIQWKTAVEIDDGRVLTLRKAYEQARIEIVESEYDRGPKFDGFIPARQG